MPLAWLWNCSLYGCFNLSLEDTILCSATHGAAFLKEIQTRILSEGAAHLSNADLLAALLGMHSIDASCLEAGWKALFGQAPHALEETFGVFQAARLLAALEIGRRTLASREQRPRLPFPKNVFRFMRAELAGASQERMFVLALNARNTLLAKQCIATGSVDTCQVDVRELFALLFRVRASTFVLVHNHPSGDLRPSLSDIALTERMARAGKLLGLPLLDHLILGDNGYVSMLTEGLLSHTSYREAQYLKIR
jgi:DNA repair protein RadC